MTAAAHRAKQMTVLDSLGAHIALIDPQGTITAVNRAWEEFGAANGAGLSAAHLVGTNYLTNCGGGPSLSPDENAIAARSGIAAVLAGQLPQFELEYPCDSPQEQRRFLMRVSPLVGDNPGAVVSHENITQRWQLEQQRTKLVAELLAANRELSDFAYVVSHDLKAPLRGISSLASWLITDSGEKLGDEGRQQLNLIASRVKRLSALIDGILTYSRAGRSRDDRLPLALAPLVQNTIDLLMPPPHIQVQVLDPLPELTIEAVKAQQVFQNLLSNAIDFIDKPQGRVTVSCVREAAMWRFSVADNGCGIDARHLPRVFLLFQTLNSRDELERTGVGLALVKKIVDLEGGRVWVESTPGQGSTFHFTLPADGPGQPLSADPEDAA